MSDLSALADDYFEATLAHSPIYASYIGDHRYDAEIDDLSPAAEAARRADLDSFRSRAQAIGDDGLDAAEVVTRELLLTAIDNELREIDHDTTGLRSDQLAGFFSAMVQMAGQFSATEPEHAHAYVQRYQKLEAYFDQASSRLRASLAAGRPPVRINIERSINQLDGYLDSPLDTDLFVSMRGPAGWDGEADWRSALRAVVEGSVRPAIARYRATLADELLPAARDNDRPGLCHVEGGDELYDALIRIHTSTELTAAEIHEIGMTEITEKLPAEYLDIGAKALGLDSLDAIFERLRTDPSLRFETSDEILEVATESLGRAKDAMGEWFGRLPRTECVIEPVPAYLAADVPPGYYYPPAGDGSRPGTYYVNTHAPADKARFDAESIGFHEAIPGHHLQLAISMELDDAPAFQRFATGNTAYVEGWALYTERLADEMGLYGSELSRMGMLTADSWRAGRLVVDTGIHAMGWTREQAIDFLAVNTPIDRAEVAVEVDRYIGMPGQALSYKIGQREIFRLRSKAEAALGADFDIRSFHDAVLEHGSVTLPILEYLVDRFIAG